MGRGGRNSRTRFTSGRDEFRGKRFGDKSSTSKFYGQEHMKTFEAWKESQDSEMEVDEAQLQEQYKAYCDEYMSQLETAFFNQHQNSEWFRERYGPKEIMHRRKEMSQWAHTEAALFSQQFQSSPKAFIASASLNPVHGSEGKWSETADEPNKRKRSGTFENSTDESFDAKAIVGHGIYAIQIRRVPAWCTRRMLIETLGMEMGDIPFLRLALTDATKSKDQEYSRGAFVMFSTDEESKTAARRLKNATITEAIVPSATTDEGDLSGIKVPRTFNLQAFGYKLRGFLTLDPSLSTPSRIAFDCEQAISLAYILDEEKGLKSSNLPNEMEVEVQNSLGLKSILEDNGVIEALNNSDDPICAKLDLVCAYLKRVHLYVYYGAQQYSSEGELLLVKTYRRNEHAKSSQTEEKVENGMEVDCSTLPAESKVPTMEQKIDEAVAARIKEAKESAAMIVKEEAVCKEFLIEEEAMIAKWLDEMTLLTDEAHARCGIKDCGKLFRDIPYVHKHLKNKHAAEMNIFTADIAVPYLKMAYEEDKEKPLPTIPLDVGSGGRNSAPSVTLKENEGQKSESNWTNQEPPWDKLQDSSWDANKERDSVNHAGPYNNLYERNFSNKRSYFRGRGRHSYGRGGMNTPQIRHGDALQVDPRQILSYVDVDAPKVTAPILDYGGAFPPPKKKMKKAHSFTQEKKAPESAE